MKKNRKREINNLVKKTFLAAGLDYDSCALGLVPLCEIITAHELYIEQLPKDADLNKNKLTPARAVDFLKQEMGLNVSNHLRRANELSGYIYVTKARGILLGCIFTDTGEITTRRRFSAAHELGHFLLHFLPRAQHRGNQNDDDGFFVFTEGVLFRDGAEAKDSQEIKIIRGVEKHEEIGVNQEEMENEANFFAAELLMPRNACLALARTYAGEYGANKTTVVRRLASEFLVSFDAMLRRLKELGFYAL